MRIVRHGEQNLGTWKVNFDGLWVLARKRQETTVAGVSPRTSVVHIIHIFVYDMFFYAFFMLYSNAVLEPSQCLTILTFGVDL